MGMTMHTTTIMAITRMDTGTDDAGLLRLMWLASPALPVGGFSYSEGLEAAVEAGRVHDEASTADWLSQQLHLTLARADLVVVVQATEAFRRGDTGRVQDLDAWVRRTRESSELRLQAEQMGKSLGDWEQSLLPGSPAPAVLTWPVAFARAAAPAPVPVRQVALAFAFSWAEAMVQAALKAVPLGQAAGQRVLHRLQTELPAAVDHALSLDDAGRQAFSPMLAILSSQHETQYSRLFRS